MCMYLRQLSAQVCSAALSGVVQPTPAAVRLGNVLDQDIIVRVLGGGCRCNSCIAASNGASVCRTRSLMALIMSLSA